MLKLNTWVQAQKFPANKVASLPEEIGGRGYVLFLFLAECVCGHLLYCINKNHAFLYALTPIGFKTMSSGALKPFKCFS